MISITYCRPEIEKLVHKKNILCHPNQLGFCLYLNAFSPHVVVFYCPVEPQHYPEDIHVSFFMFSPYTNISPWLGLDDKCHDKCTLLSPADFIEILHRIQTPLPPRPYCY